EDRGNHWFSGVGRLKPGVSIERARADLDAVSRDLEQQYPATNKGVRALPASMIDYYAGSSRTPLLLLMGAVGFVMLIACTNVVLLLLARIIGRSREIAVRLALGVDRWRLLRMLLAESLIVAVTGGLAGVLLSMWAVHWALASQPRLLPRANTIHLDASSLVFAFAITAATLLVLGLIPAFSSNTDVMEAMQSAGRGGTDRRRLRMGWTLIAAEIAMASMLLMGAGLMIETLRNLTHVQLGYQPEHVVAVEFSLSPFKYTSDAQVEAASQRMLESIQSLPGVTEASFAAPFSVGGNGMLPPVSLPGRSNLPTLPLIAATSVSPGFFETLHIPLRTGRYFIAGHSKKKEVVVNEEFARRFFPGENPVGQRIDQNGVQEIVGVVGDTRLQGPVSRETPEVYWLGGEGGWAYGTMLIRVAGSPDSVATQVRDRLKHAESEIRLTSVAPLELQEEGRTALPRFTRSLLLIFAALAVILAAMGMYGVASYGVAQRRREIGVRVALGASFRDVAWLVTRQTFSATLAGTAVGAAGGALLARVLASQFYGVGARDPGIYLTVLILIIVVAAAAAIAPVMTAARIDPAISLRQE
ncbi:MAG TPA: FtsX-like permease family protein, partial [Bryobacteraceae bacterium]